MGKSKFYEIMIKYQELRKVPIDDVKVLTKSQVRYLREWAQKGSMSHSNSPCPKVKGHLPKEVRMGLPKTRSQCCSTVWLDHRKKPRFAEKVESQIVPHPSTQYILQQLAKIELTLHISENNNGSPQPEMNLSNADQVGEIDVTNEMECHAHRSENSEGNKIT